MRDVAYEMMLTKTRKSIHLRVADALEKRHKMEKEKVVGLLAYHYFMADHWSKAFAYNIEAGHHARRIFACQTALVCFERAIKILETYRPQNHRVMQMTVLKWKGLMHYCCGTLQHRRPGYLSDHAVPGPKEPEQSDGIRGPVSGGMDQFLFAQTATGIEKPDGSKGQSETDGAAPDHIEGHEFSSAIFTLFSDDLRQEESFSTRR